MNAKTKTHAKLLKCMTLLLCICVFLLIYYTWTWKGQTHILSVISDQSMLCWWCWNKINLLNKLTNNNCFACSQRIEHCMRITMIETVRRKRYMTIPCHFFHSFASCPLSPVTPQCESDWVISKLLHNNNEHRIDGWWFMNCIRREVNESERETRI